MTTTCAKMRSGDELERATISCERRATRRGRARGPLSLLGAGALCAASALLPLACEPVDGARERVGEGEARAGLTCPWDPLFGSRYCYQGDWWVEFSVDDPTTSTLTIEINEASGTRFTELPYRMPLAGDYVKFSGGPGSGPIPEGASIRLLATQSADAGGLSASSAWFPYRTGTPAADCDPCTPSCAPGSCGDNGCGGTCACAGGEVCLADQTCCHPNANTCGPDGCGGSHGPCACVPICAGQQCGDDGCGGSCGACALGTTCASGACVGGCAPSWSPLWEQTASSGSWWAEFDIAGGGSMPRSASLEVVGGTTYPMSLSYRPWVTGLWGVPAGTWMVLHAVDATGASAHTAPFRYLVDTVPVSDPCLGTASSSPSCHPLARGMVTFTMDDSHPSQLELAAPRLAQHGFKATIFHITTVLDGYGLLPVAQQLAQLGHEVGSHTKTHPYLPGLAPAVLGDELSLSKQYLVANVGGPVGALAAPMGAYDDTTIDAARAHFTSLRTVDAGLNTMGSDLFRLKADGVYNTSSVAEICSMLTRAAVYKGWQILVFHDFTAEPSTTSTLTYPISHFDDVLACAGSTPGLDVVTIGQGTAVLTCAAP
jgi:peptidoglycan/xylan/chitin deacetylase (PgdA/CDA1 family)